MFLIRRFNLLISAIANLIQTGLALFYAIQDNTEALKANTASTDKILNTALMCLHIEAVKTQKAVSYLAAVEKQRQQSAGQPHAFEVI